MKSLPRLLAVGWIAFFLAGSAPAATQLYWVGGNAGEWNSTTPNWATSPYATNLTTFTPGDSVTVFYGALFIGRNGVALPVSPSNAVFSGQSLVYGGDITGPARVIIVDEESLVLFSNYTGGLSFTGGTLLTDEATLIIDAGTAPGDATMWFGQAPISIDEGVIRIRSSVPSRSVTLANPLDFEDGGLLDFSSCAGPGIVSGLLRLLTTANFITGGELGGEPVRITGAVEVGEADGSWGPSLWRWFGSRRDLVVSGSLVNGEADIPGNRAPLELLNLDRGQIRFTGINSFTQGCYVAGNPYVAVDPLGTDYSIEVAAGSSLGTGDVRVESNGVLRALGAGAVHPSARLSVQGSVYVGANVTLQCRELTLGEAIHTSGTFDHNNSGGHIVGPGRITVQCGVSGASVPPFLSVHFTEAPAAPGVVLSFITAPCQGYEIQVSPSLAHPEWDSVAKVAASAEARPVSVIHEFNPFVRRLFFRTVSSTNR